jgi:hypothetical protein
MTTSNFNRKLVQTLQETFITNIKLRMTDRGLNQIEFKSPFRIYMEESSYDNDYVRVPWVAQSLFQDGSMLVQGETEKGSVRIESLDIYELAMIMDILESGDYTVDEEEFIDPAGGRGLQSHI